MKKTLLIMAGGTGGHVFPALAIVNALKARQWQVIWLGTATGLEARLVPAAHIPFIDLSISGLRGTSWRRWLTAPFLLIQAMWKVMGIIRLHRPTLVLGMGGFVSGPGGLAAWLMRYPLIIHEQNAIPGTTNQLLAPLAKRICTGFPHVFAHRANAIYTGNPLRASFTPTAFPEKTIPHPDEPYRLLVLGGSRGAHALNENIPLALSKTKAEWRVWHQTGEADREQVMQTYAKAKITAKVEAFIDPIEIAYQWADFVICRSGALTISELSAAGVASLLIPYPYASDDHQTKNALHLVDKGAAWMIKQNQLTESMIISYLDRFCTEEGKALTLAARQSTQGDATQAVVAVCEGFEG